MMIQEDIQERRKGQEPADIDSHCLRWGQIIAAETEDSLIGEELPPVEGTCIQVLGIAEIEFL